jgi:signal transduction histidine kinase
MIGASRGGSRGDSRPGGPSDDGWMRRIWWLWHACFAVALAAVLAILISDQDSWLSYLLLAAIGAAYVLMPGDDDQNAVRYLVVAVPAVLVLGYLDPSALLLLYALFPQIFGILRDWRTRLAVIGGLALGSVLVSLHHSDVVATAVGVGSALLLSLVIGVFTQLTLTEATRRGELIRELETVRADLDEAHREAGVLAERERLSHEIHDTLAQGFTSLLMLVQAADSTAETDPATTRERLALAERTARENLAEARSLVAALAPAPLRAMPLDTAIQRITARCGEEAGVVTEAKILGTPRDLPADVQVVLLRATQESLANVRKHAAAASVGVRLEYLPQGMLLEVRDDGAGFVPPGDSAPAGGAAGERMFGLLGMRARVEQVSGTLEVCSAPGRGTTVRVEIP